MWPSVLPRLRLHGLARHRRHLASAPTPTKGAPPVKRAAAVSAHATLPNNAGPYHVPTRRRPHLPKRQNPYHRSSALISSLRHEEALRLIRSSRAVLAQRIPAPRAGMLIRVAYAPSLAPEAPVHYFTGICIAAARRGLGSCVVLRNVVDGVAVERAFACYSPLVRDATVLAQRNVRKSKLYYLRRKPLRQSNVGKATQRPQ